MTDVLGVLPSNTATVSPKTFDPSSPEPVSEGIEAVNKCLAAAVNALNFDIAELWRFGPDATLRSTTVPPPAGVGGGSNGSKPSCEHVYAQSAILKTYTGRIAGIWKSGFDDSQAPQRHVFSPPVSARSLKFGKRELG